jgi:hypothetical protein
VAALGLVEVVLVAVVITIPERSEASSVMSYAHSGNRSALFTALEKGKGRCA